MNDLYGRLRQLPVVDVHTHFERYLDTFGYTMPQFLYYCSYAVCYGVWFLPEDVRRMQSPEASEREQFTALLRMLKTIRYSQTARLAERIAALAGFPLEESAFDGLSAWYRGRTEERVRGAAPRVQAYIANSAGHPLYGGVPGLRAFLDGARIASPGVYRTLTVTGLHSIHTPAELEELGQAAGMEIETFADWEKACEKLIGAFVSLGIVAFKELHLYFRPPEIDVPDFARAAVEFAALRRGGSAAKNLQDAMLFRVYELLAGTGLPVQVHTGATLDGAKSAGYLWEYAKLIQAFPKIQFDLLHLNYPLLEIYWQVLRSCPNTYGDATWIVASDPACVVRHLDWALDAFPIERTCLFGSDRHCAGYPVAAALEQADEVLAAFFAPRIERGQLSAADAEDVARRWLYGNPKALFRI